MQWRVLPLLFIVVVVSSFKGAPVPGVARSSSIVASDYLDLAGLRLKAVAFDLQVRTRWEIETATGPKGMSAFPRVRAFVHKQRPSGDDSGPLEYNEWVEDFVPRASGGIFYSAEELLVSPRDTIDIPEVATEVITRTKAQIETALGGTLPPQNAAGGMRSVIKLVVSANLHVPITGAIVAQDEDFRHVGVTAAGNGGPVEKGTNLPGDFP